PKRARRRRRALRCRRGAAPLLDPARSVGRRVRANVEVPLANRAYLVHPTGQAQTQTRMLGSRSTESFRCSCMAALGFVGGVSSLIDAAGPSLRPSERGAHSRQRSAATTLWSSYSFLSAPECRLFCTGAPVLGITEQGLADHARSHL